MNAVDDMFGYWFAGLTDGEGSFLINKSCRNGIAYYRPRFSLELRCDESVLIERIRNTLSVGRIYHHSRNNGRLHGINRSDTTTFRVDSRDNRVLVSLFKRYPLQSSKRQDFECWAQAVELYCAGNTVALQTYKERLEEGRRHKKLEATLLSSMSTVQRGISRRENEGPLSLLCPRLPNL